MTVKPESVAEGKCYVTSNNQVRKVIKITNDLVRYERRGARTGWSGHYINQNLGRFANAVSREVTCDWNPDYRERTP